MPTTQDVYSKSTETLKTAGAHYREFEHEPVFDYETAAVIRQRFGLQGVESKNLFLKTKKGEYCMLITVQGKRADFDALKEVLGSKVSVASHDELKEKTGCEPNCATPLGHPAEVILVVDNEIFRHHYFIFSPGPAERTVEMLTEEFRRVLQNVPNKVLFI